MSHLYLYDDVRARSFEPFASSRPCSELVAGTTTIRRRWELVTGVAARGFVSGQHLVEFEETGAPGFAAAAIPAGSLIVNSRFVVALDAMLQEELTRPERAAVWTCAGRTVAVRTAVDVAHSQLSSGELKLELLAPATTGVREVEGAWLNNVWDLVALLPDQIVSDVSKSVALADAGSPTILPAAMLPANQLQEAATVLGDHPVVIAADAALEPYVVIDARGGPVVLSSETRVDAFTRLVGPCFVASGSHILGGRVGRSSIGPVTKVHGEVTDVLMLGYSNKAHDGFLGHSVVGRWCNLGAGTITSNLKNTYGHVSLWTPAGVRDTGMQFLGTMFGDYSRTGIGMLLATGSVIGVGCNVFGNAMPPRMVAPFTWYNNGASEPYELEKFIQVAARVLARRHVDFSDGIRRHLTEVYRARRPQ